MNNCNQLAKWWELTLDGDVKAFGRIHDELYSSLTFYLNKIVKDEDAAQDILQDLFVKLWERRERLGLISNVKCYFFKSARSLAINYLKAARPELLELTNDQRIDVVFSAEDIFLKKETGLEIQNMLAAALNGLPKRQREMICLKYFDDWNYNQIAEVTGLQYQSVINHVHRGINQLRQTLAEAPRFSAREMAV